MNNHDPILHLIQSIALLIGVALGHFLAGITLQNIAWFTASCYSIMSAYVLWRDKIKSKKGGQR